MTSSSHDLPQGYPFMQDLEITPKQAAAALTERPDQILVIDCREPAEWGTSRIAGTVLIPLGEIQSRIEEIEGMLKPEVAVICHHGRRSMKAAMLLRQLGVENAMSIAGGIDWWSRAVDPSIPRYTKDASGVRILG